MADPGDLNVVIATPQRGPAKAVVAMLGLDIGRAIIFSAYALHQERGLSLRNSLEEVERMAQALGESADLVLILPGAIPGDLPPFLEPTRSDPLKPKRPKSAKTWGLISGGLTEHPGGALCELLNPGGTKIGVGTPAGRIETVRGDRLLATYQEKLT